ncbi:MAG TPA: hypothetical protein DCL54_18285 [Alphaproteobacteria bacterium]|nr:hypothetical protein [Alphaproteobacteria bacterium]HAJ48530.1 hypothetical protein [Alphaproteobacteria bacterium]
METILDSLHTFFDSFPAWLNAIFAVISAASAITALTATPKDDQIVGKLHRLLQVIALNIGYARRNEQTPPEQKP